jgi:hypothetical protein
MPIWIYRILREDPVIKIERFSSVIGQILKGRGNL